MTFVLVAYSSLFPMVLILPSFYSFRKRFRDLPSSVCHIFTETKELSFNGIKSRLLVLFVVMKL